jgi:hypothetical protein
LEQSISAAITDALQFRTPDRHNHLIELTGRFRLSLYVAMRAALWILADTKQTRRFRERHFAHSAAAILDIKVARHIRWMWCMFFQLTPRFLFN